MPLHAVRHLAQVDFAGPDAGAFLQGYVTADLDGLAPGRALPMALCNLKGRVVASGWAAGVSNHVHLLVHPSVVPILTRELGKYLLFAKSKLNEPRTGLRLSPGKSPDAVELPPVGHYATLSAPDDGHAEFATACAAAGFVLVTEAIAGSFLPQMIGLTDVGAVNFAKGCYLGQEVVARAEHRGQVKQQLRRYEFDGEGPAVGADVMAASRKIGTVVAVGNGVVLAAVRSEDSPVQADGCAMAISPAP